MKKLELNIETLRCLDQPQPPQTDDQGRSTHFCTVTCNHTTCEVC